MGGPRGGDGPEGHQLSNGGPFASHNPPHQVRPHRCTPLMCILPRQSPPSRALPTPPLHLLSLFLSSSGFSSLCMFPAPHLSSMVSISPPPPFLLSPRCVFSVAFRPCTFRSPVLNPSPLPRSFPRQALVLLTGVLGSTRRRLPVSSIVRCPCTDRGDRCRSYMPPGLDPPLGDAVGGLFVKGTMEGSHMDSTVSIFGGRAGRISEVEERGRQE